MTLVLVAGTTWTATIDGISAAGADPALMAHTPAADAEILTYGEPVYAPATPVSPSGCPTPALVTRAVQRRLGFETLIVDAGLARPTAAPTVTTADDSGADVRKPEPVPAAADVFETARELGRALPDDVVVAETIPGGTTTALGVCTALGEQFAVSSSLPENPTALKRRVVDEGLAASELAPGDCAGRPLDAVRQMGDPVLATVAGLVDGALEAGTAPTLAGGTQMLAAVALLRHAGREDALTVATTSFVAEDETATVADVAASLDVDLVVTDPGFDRETHVALARFAAGEAKEGAGMGGALARARRSDISLETIRRDVADLYSDLLADPGPNDEPDDEPNETPDEGGGSEGREAVNGGEAAVSEGEAAVSEGDETEGVDG